MNAGAAGGVGGGGRVAFEHRAWSPAADAPIAMEVTVCVWGDSVSFILFLFF